MYMDCHVHGLPRRHCGAWGSMQGWWLCIVILFERRAVFIERVVWRILPAQQTQTKEEGFVLLILLSSFDIFPGQTSFSACPGYGMYVQTVPVAPTYTRSYQTNRVSHRVEWFGSCLQGEGVGEENEESCEAGGYSRRSVLCVCAKGKKPFNVTHLFEIFVVIKLSFILPFELVLLCLNSLLTLYWCDSLFCLFCRWDT